MSVIAKAMELGQEISNSAELKDWKNAEAAVLVDAEASALIREFQTKQHAMKHARSEGQQLSKDENDVLVDLHKRMTAHPKIQEFVDSQRRFQQMIDSVNQILHQAINGGGCSGGG